MDNNRIENQIRPWALGRKNWLFSGSLAAGGRAADIMSLMQTAKMTGIEPLAYLTDVLTRLPMHLPMAVLRNCCLHAGGHRPTHVTKPIAAAGQGWCGPDVYEKLNVTNTAALMRYAMQHQLLE